MRQFTLISTTFPSNVIAELLVLSISFPSITVVTMTHQFIGDVKHRVRSIIQSGEEFFSRVEKSDSIDRMWQEFGKRKREKKYILNVFDSSRSTNKLKDSRKIPKNE